MEPEPTTTNLNPNDLSFLRNRTGAESDEEVVQDAVAFYKKAVFAAVYDEPLTAPDWDKQTGEETVQLVDLPSGRLAYARDNSDVPTLTGKEITATLARVIADDQRHRARTNGIEPE